MSFVETHINYNETHTSLNKTHINPFETHTDFNKTHISCNETRMNFCLGLWFLIEKSEVWVECCGIIRQYEFVGAIVCLFTFTFMAQLIPPKEDIEQLRSSN